MSSYTPVSDQVLGGNVVDGTPRYREVIVDATFTSTVGRVAPVVDCSGMKNLAVSVHNNGANAVSSLDVKFGAELDGSAELDDPATIVGDKVVNKPPGASASCFIALNGVLPKYVTLNGAATGGDTTGRIVLSGQLN